MVRVQPIYQHDSKVKFAKVIPIKKDLINYKSPKEFISGWKLTPEQIQNLIKKKM